MNLIFCASFVPQRKRSFKKFELKAYCRKISQILKIWLGISWRLEKCIDIQGIDLLINFQVLY